MTEDLGHTLHEKENEVKEPHFYPAGVAVKPLPSIIVTILVGAVKPLPFVPVTPLCVAIKPLPFISVTLLGVPVKPLPSDAVNPP